MTLTVDLVWFNAGGGHRAAAIALAQGLSMQGLGWRVRGVDLVDVLDPTAVFRRHTGIAPEDLYNKRLSSGFTLGLRQELRLLQAGIRMAHGPLVQRLSAHWRRTRPDLVVSLIPNFNRSLHDALAAARPEAPFVTVMTDLTDHPPHFWAEPGTRQHLVCGTEKARQQALAGGLAPDHVHRVHGMLLRPEFHEAAPDAAARAAERGAAGLPAHEPTGVVLFGGPGSRTMLRIARKLPRTPLILLCGRNAALAESLARRPASAPRVVVGQTSEVARWMRLADFFIGKPGPGSLSEALQCGLPAIVARNAWTLPQERWNTDWVQQHGLGIVLRSFGEVAPAVDRLVADLDAAKSRTRSVRNDAIVAVPRLLQHIAARHAAAALRPPPAAPLRLAA